MKKLILAFVVMMLLAGITQAQELGANAVVNVRFATSSITAGAAELYCYGTAVVVEAAAGTQPAPATGEDV